MIMIDNGYIYIYGYLWIFMIQFHHHLNSYNVDDSVKVASGPSISLIAQGPRVTFLGWRGT